MTRRDLPSFYDLRDFLRHLEAAGQLVQIDRTVSAVHEITEIHRRVLAADGPALLLTQVVKADGKPSEYPVVVNLFGTAERVAWGLGVRPGNLRELGETLAEMHGPRPPRDMRDAMSKLSLARAALSTRPRVRRKGCVQDIVWTGDDIDLFRLPIQVPWPGEPAPLITWPLVITHDPDRATPDGANMGVYRMQVLGRDRTIMRWLDHRGGARHHRQWTGRGLDMPVAVVIGADPATILSAVLPLPENVSELTFSGLLRGTRPDLVPCVSVPLAVPANAEIVIEGYVSSKETAPEGPYGDHTGYFNSVELFPVMRVTAITMRRSPIYMSTFTGRAPDEPSRIGEVLNELFVPFVRRQFPEVADIWLPPETCSYRIAIVSIHKRYPGQARRLMLGLWSLLPQMTYTKFLIVVDSDVDVRTWSDVMWAVATRSDPSRDLLRIDDTPIDYLDFASPKPSLGGKLGIDATSKIGSETVREWGKVIVPDEDVATRVNGFWDELGLSPQQRPGVGR